MEPYEVFTTDENLNKIMKNEHHNYEKLRQSELNIDLYYEIEKTEKEVRKKKNNEIKKMIENECEIMLNLKSPLDSELAEDPYHDL
mmetsp:Transcript_14556/g.2109  ORF Transcript_14556/g.2109 Transcript_14556/m.2109 type:complete len:86 (+) Transcript_14556:199-456(+)